MSTNINILSSGIENRFAVDSVDSTIYYCGTAKLNTPEGTIDAWTIVKLEVAPGGAVTKTTAVSAQSGYDFNWVDREHLDYV
jgi:hypothetical protein